MILEEDPTLRTQIAGALAPEGVDILSFGRLAPAKEAARRANLDILVLGESVEGRLAHDVALLAEWRNPRLGSILLSDREAQEADELFDLIPSLQAVLARRTGPRTLARVALATARSQEGIVLLREEDAGEEGQDDAPLAEAGAAPVRDVADLACDMTAPAREIAAPAWDTASPAWDAAAPVQETAAPIREIAAPVREVAPLAPVPFALARPEPEPAQDVSSLIRQVMAEVRSAPVPEDLAPAFLAESEPAPAALAAEATAPAHSGTPSGRLYVLPNFLRDADAEEESEADLPPGLPPAEMLPVRAAAPMRRLNLA